jgi:hypothetical protein
MTIVYAWNIAGLLYVVPFLTLYTQLAKNHSVGIRLVFMLSMLGDELPTL